MRILFVILSSTEMNSSAMIRNRALIKGLIKNGHTIDLLTIATQNKNSFYDETIIWDDKVNIIKLNNNSLYSELTKEASGIKAKIKQILIPIIRKIYHKVNIFDNTIRFAKSMKISKLKKKSYELIISSSDPKTSHIAVNSLIKSGLKYKKWIQYWGDPLSTDITNKSIYPRFYLRRIEKKILSNADAVVYVSPFTYKEQIKFFPYYKNKMKFIPIPYIDNKTYDNKTYDKIMISELNLGYFGDYKSSIRNISPLYKVCVNEKINLTIAGNSDVKLKETNKVDILPRVSQTDLNLLEEKSDILICLLNKSGNQLPGKLYHYAGTNKPILVILDGEMNNDVKKYLKKFNRFIICENNYDSVLECIKSIDLHKMEYSPSIEFAPEKIAKDFINSILI